MSTPQRDEIAHGGGSPTRPAIEVLDREDAFGVGVGSDILVVDDHEATLVAYQAALEPLGRKVVIASSGMDAVQRLLEQDFALMLLDVAMPGMDGLETARLARQRPRNRGLPIIFITGEASSTKLIVDAYDIGASDFVMKPIMPEVLRAKARVYLDLQERTRALVGYARQLHEANVHATRSETIHLAEMAGTERRLSKLQQATAELARAHTPAEVAAVTVRLGAETVSASRAALWTISDDGGLALLGEHGYGDNYLDPFRIIAPGTKLPIMRAIATNDTIWCESDSDFERHSPETYVRARAAGLASAFAAIPLRSSGRPIGVMTVGYDGDHAFPPSEREFLETLVHATEQSLDRARLYVVEQTARREAEESNRRKDELMAMLGHELRNPLAAMVSAFELLKLRDGVLPRELAISKRQLDHLTRLVNNLVDVASVTRGAISLRREVIEVSDAIADALVLAKPVLDQHRHEIVVDVSPNLRVDADRERIAQVFANLLTNAAKYTPGTGRIEITASRLEAVAQITVRDNGVGITPSLLASLFEAFVQGERPLDRSAGGLGIGLTLVQRIVELHGGTVAARSDGPGTGATFTVHWPLSTPRSRPATLDDPFAPQRPLRILVIEDNRDAAGLFARLLEMLGHRIEIAHDGSEALDRARTFAPELAFLDIGLPGRDGYTVVGELRALPACAATVFVALTGYGRPEDRELALRAGFDHHFVKPIEMRALTPLLASIAAVTR